VKRSTDHIVVTHCGSLPRPESVLPLLSARDSGQEYDVAGLADRLAESVCELVHRQVDLGVDVVDDGEHTR